MKIDAHSHFLPREVIEEIRKMENATTLRLW